MQAIVRKVRGVGIAIAVVIGALVAIHVVGAIFSIVGTLAALLIPGAILFVLAFLLYKLFLQA